MLVRLLVCAGLLAGCLKANLQTCGDLLCPADAVCLPSGQCATKDSLTACEGVADGGACTTSLFTGSCVMGVCTAPRCGDGVVSGSEQCDGTVTGVDCVDYGFDTGVPTCSDRCGLDVVGSCVRFGWERVYSEAVMDAWTNGTLFGLITDTRKRIVLYSGTHIVQDVTLTYQAHIITGNGSTVAVGMDDRIMRSDNGGPFQEVSIAATNDSCTELRVGDDGSLYMGAFDGSGARVYHQTASGWQKLLDVPDLAWRLMYTAGELYISYDSGKLDHYTGSSWTTITTTPEPARDMRVRPGGGFYIAAGDSGVFELVGTTLTKIHATGLHAFPIGNELYIGDFNDSLVRRDLDSIGRVERVEGPLFGDITTDGTDIYQYGNGVYRFTGTAFSARSGLSEAARDIKQFATGDFALVSVDEILKTDPLDDSTWIYDQPNGSPLSIAGHSSNDYFVNEGDDLEYYNGTAYSAVTFPTGATGIADILWDDPTSTLYAVGAGGVALKRVGTTWTALPSLAGCDLTELAPHGTDLYLVGTCGTEGAIWKFAGTTWTELHRSSVPLVAVWADASDNLYAAGPSGGITRVAGIWHDEPRARGVSISATGPGDIWVGGGPEDLLHWDGTVWSRVRLVGAASPHVLATPRAVYIAGASTSVLVR